MNFSDEVAPAAHHQLVFVMDPSRRRILIQRPHPAESIGVTIAFKRLSAEYLDICSAEVDAIVNPAHADLLGGGGLDGMIHDDAGPELLEACRVHNGCEVGDAKTTPGFALPARWVIHTVGPIWRGGAEGEDELLASCYRRCLEEAVEVGAQTVAFPGISTGLHRFPTERAANIAVREVRRFLERSGTPRLVLFACFGHASLMTYQRLLSVSE